MTPGRESGGACANLLADAVRRRVRSLDAQLPVTDVETTTAVMQESVSDRRFNLVLLSAFATMASIRAWR